MCVLPFTVEVVIDTVMLIHEGGIEHANVVTQVQMCEIKVGRDVITGAQTFNIAS